MNTQVSHLQFNVHAENLPFYKELLAFLGCTTLYEADNMLGVAAANGTSLWFSGQVKDVANDYDGPGMNHLGFGVAAQSDVDTSAGYLRDHKVDLLFETPRHRPEFSAGEDQTYYQVMFESPDRILFEIVYIGPKSA